VKIASGWSIAVTKFMSRERQHGNPQSDLSAQRRPNSGLTSAAQRMTSVFLNIFAGVRIIVSVIQ
jgi:hypothetical protein